MSEKKERFHLKLTKEENNVYLEYFESLAVMHPSMKKKVYLEFYFHST